MEAIVRLVVQKLIAAGPQFGHPWRFDTGGTGFVAQLLVEAIHIILKFFVLRGQAHDLVGKFGIGGGELCIGSDQGLHDGLVIGGSHIQVVEVRFHGIGHVRTWRGFVPSWRGSSEDTTGSAKLVLAAHSIFLYLILEVGGPVPPLPILLSTGRRGNILPFVVGSWECAIHQHGVGGDHYKRSVSDGFS